MMFFQLLLLAGMILATYAESSDCIVANFAVMDDFDPFKVWQSVVFRELQQK